MSRSTYSERTFQCECNIREKRYKWSDDEKPELCSCGKEMEETEEEKGEGGNFMKFSSMSKEQKQIKLKQRSHEHYKKFIAPRKKEEFL